MNLSSAFYLNLEKMCEMTGESTLISYSANESDLLNIRVGRCVVATDFNELALVEQIVDGAYDICRLTVPAGNEDVVNKLEKTGLLYYYSGSITRYKTLISDLPEREFIHNDLEYEQYDGTQNDLLLQLLIGTWGTYPIGYYRTPFLNRLITKEQEILCVFEFYKKNNLQKNNPDNTIMFIRHKGNYVGFFALNIIGNRLESHIGGIVEPYRKDGYFFDMQEYIRRFCIKNNLKYFCFGARNENRRVNSIFQKYGYHASDADNVFHIAALLHSNRHEEMITSEIHLTGNDTTAVYNMLLEKCMRFRESVLKDSSAVLTFRCNHLTHLKNGNYNLVLTFPVISGQETLITVKIYDTEKKLVSFGHLYSN